jgi:hypothetical protein
VCDKHIPSKVVVIRPDDKPFMNNSIRTGQWSLQKFDDTSTFRIRFGLLVTSRSIHVADEGVIRVGSPTAFVKLYKSRVIKVRYEKIGIGRGWNSNLHKASYIPMWKTRV